MTLLGEVSVDYLVVMSPLLLMYSEAVISWNLSLIYVMTRWLTHATFMPTLSTVRTGLLSLVFRIFTRHYHTPAL